jgi:DNA-binding IclR family transcriptional regulator
LAYDVLERTAMREVVPASVRELIRERVQALEHIEVLLLMHGQPERGWSVKELAAQLQLSVALVEAALAHLGQHGFVAVDGERYCLAAHEQASVDELAQSYEAARPELLALISSDAMGRVRRRMRQLRDRLNK